jgi:hypothetical protein
MVKLINNLWKYIFYYLDSRSLQSASCVDKSFNKLTQDKSLWKEIVRKETDVEIFQHLEYADDLVENVWKVFSIQNLHEFVSTMNILNNDHITYFNSQQRYRTFTLDRVDDTTLLVLLLRAEDTHIDKYTICSYCGYFKTDTSYIVRKGRIISNNLIYVGELEFRKINLDHIIRIVGKEVNQVTEQSHIIMVVILPVIFMVYYNRTEHKLECMVI